MHNGAMKKRTSSLIKVCLLATLTGCTQFPALDETITPQMEAAPYPDLLPLGPVIAQTQAGAIDTAATETQLNARVSALRARAKRMRGSVLQGPERQRLAEGLQ